MALLPVDGDQHLNWTRAVKGNPSHNGQWVDFGHADNGDLYAIYYGADHLYKSTDDGATWDESAAIGFYPYKVLVLPTGRLIVGEFKIGGAALRISDNGGASWSSVCSPGAATRYWLEIVRLGDGTLLASTCEDSPANGRLYRSTNNGDSWTEVGVPYDAPNTSSRVSGIKEMVEGTLIAGISGPELILKSIDGGLNWVKATVNIPYWCASNIKGFKAACISGTNWLAGTFEEGATNNWSQIYRSLDNGTTWDYFSGLECPTSGIKGMWAVGTHVLLATNSDYGVDVLQSDDDGEHWSPSMSSALSSKDPAEGEIFCYVFKVWTNPRLVMLVGTEASIWRCSTYATFHPYDIAYEGTRDTGQTVPWERSSVASFDNGRRLWILVNSRGTSGGRYVSDDNGQTWLPCELTGVVGDPTYILKTGDSSAILWSTNNAGDGSWRVYQTSDYGDHWDLLYNSALEDWDTVWAAIKLASGTLLCGTYAGYIYRSIDNGITWTWLNTMADLIVVYDFAQALNGTVTVGGYAAGNYGLSYSVDDGQTWTNVSTLPTMSETIRTLKADGNTVYAGGDYVYLSTVYYKYLYRSTDGGVTWTGYFDFNSIFGGVLVTEVEVAPNGDLYVAVAEWATVFKSTDGGATWQEFFHNGNSIDIDVIEFLPSGDPLLYSLTSRVFYPHTLTPTPPTPPPVIPPPPAGYCEQGKYEIWVWDPWTGELKTIITDIKNVEIEHTLNSFSTLTFSIDGEYEAVNYLVCDAIIEVRRTIADTKYTEYTGFHRTPQFEMTDKDHYIFTSYGRGLLDLLQRRAILYPAKTGYTLKAGYAETVIKALVNENATGGATVAVRYYKWRTPGLTIETDAARGLNWSGAIAHQNLLEALQDIATAGLVDFDIVRTAPLTFDFRCYYPQRGTDKSEYLAFSPELGNLIAPSYTVSRTEEATVVAVLGEGQGRARRVTIATSPAMGDSPWNVIEHTHDAAGATRLADYQTEGAQAIAELAAKESFEFQVLQVPISLYGRDYRVGDVCEVRWGPVVRKKKIVGAKVVMSEGKEDIDIVFSDLPIRKA